MNLARTLRPLSVPPLVALTIVACGETAEDSPTGRVGQAPAIVDRQAVPAEFPPLDPPEGTKPSLLLITVDTLRHDALGFSAGHDATPTIDALAASGRVFTRAFAQNVVTLPSHTNILTGLYPFQHGVRDNSGFTLADDVPTLATVLTGAGYRTAAFVGAFPLDARFGLDRGFEVYDDRYHVERKLNEFAVEARRGDRVVEGGLRWWHEHAGEPRFMWLHLYDPHAPYDPPLPFAERFAEDPYRGEVAAVDHFLEPVLGPLLRGQQGSTVVVFTSDHGEALGDHGELTHGLFAYDATLRVPLILWGPGILPGRDERTVGHVDLLPTLLDLFGLPAPPDLPGRSLAEPGDAPREVYFEALSAYLNRGWAPLRGLVRGTTKYIELPVPELYDLAADPTESDNVLARERGLYRSLRDAMPAEAGETPSRRTISDEEVAKLRALGYLASDTTPKSRFTEADDPKNLIAVDRQVHELTVLAGDGRLDEAEKLGRALIEQRPDMSLAYLRLSTVLREGGRLGEAVELLRGALARGLEQPEIVRELGLTLAEARQAEEAAVLLEPLAGSGDPKTLNALGVAYFTAGRLDEARAILEEVLAEDSDNLKALESLGAVALSSQDAEGAIRYLERALAVNPDLPIAWNTLGVARKWHGDVAGALEAWQRAVEIDPRLLDAWYNLGRVAVDEKRWQTARRAFEEYVARAPAERFAAEVSTARQILERLPPG